MARGQDRPGSDIDLLVSLGQDAKPLDLVGFALDAEDLLGAHVDVATIESLRPHLRDAVMADAVDL